MKKIFEGNPHLSQKLPSMHTIKGIPGMWASLSELSLCVKSAGISWREFTPLYHLAFPKLKVNFRSLRFTSYEKSDKGKWTLYQDEGARGFNHRISRLNIFRIYVPFEWAFLVIQAAQSQVIWVEIPTNHVITLHYVPDREKRFEDTTTLTLTNVRQCLSNGISPDFFTRVPRKDGRVGKFNLFEVRTGKPLFIYF